MHHNIHTAGLFLRLILLKQSPFKTHFPIGNFLCFVCHGNCSLLRSPCLRALIWKKNKRKIFHAIECKNMFMFYFIFECFSHITRYWKYIYSNRTLSTAVDYLFIVLLVFLIRSFHRKSHSLSSLGHFGWVSMLFCGFFSRIFLLIFWLVPTFSPNGDDNL